MDNNTIYNLASRDVHTNSISSRDENGIFKPTNGITAILLHDQFKPLRTYSSELQSLQTKKQDVLTSMLQLQTPFEDDLKNTLLELKENDLEIKMNSAEKALLDDKIKDEEMRLLARGYEFPSITENAPEKKIEIKNKWNWKKFFAIGLKWFGVGVFVLVIETFFGLAQFDFLSEYKSNTAIWLRIAASGLLIISLHWAEYIYKVKEAKQFKWYIVFGVIALCVNLFLPLILNYFFQDSIATTEVTTGWEDISNSGIIATNPEVTKTSFIGFLNRFDFLPALFSILVFLLMYLLNKGEKKEIIQEVAVSVVNKPNNEAFNRLIYLKKELLTQEKKSMDLKSTTNYAKNKSSNTIEVIKNSLNASKIEVLGIDKKIADLNVQIDSMISIANAQLKTYEIDFKDIISTEVKAQFITPVWPNEADIKQFYKLK